MVSPFIPLHPMGEDKNIDLKPSLLPDIAETYAGKIQVDWDPEAAVTPLGQLAFFIAFLKQGGRYDQWIKDCPLSYASNNAPGKADVLGSFFLSILSGHNRYSHISRLTNDQVSSELLGMKKIVSDDCVRTALTRIAIHTDGTPWIQRHLYDSYSPLLDMPWIMDIDTTIKPLYGHQEGAVVGYNPQKPGRPSHTYHTYFIANIRLALDVEVLAGDQSHSNYTLPGLMSLLEKLPAHQRPQFIRGDIGFGTDNVMTELESIGMNYLFKLKKSGNVQKLIYQQHGKGEWTVIRDNWEAKEACIQLCGWKQSRRVTLIRRRLNSDAIIGLEYKQKGQRQLALIDEPENMRLYEYSVLVTNLDADLVALFYHYRDRADCENVFDELKKQWGWCGYTTKDIARCQLTARMIALIYNWWNLYVRLALPDKHYEAMSSRPLLLTGVGRLTESARQKTLTITTTHGNQTLLSEAYDRLARVFTELKSNTPQLSPDACWRWLLEKATVKFRDRQQFKPMPAPA